nr:urotensin-2B isoform X3 [Macaca nemestrina]
MLTSAILGRGPGCPFNAASRPPPAPSGAPERSSSAGRGAKSGRQGSQAGEGSGSGGQGLVTKAAGDGPRRTRLAAQLPRRHHAAPPPPPAPRPRPQSVPNTRSPEMGRGRPVRRERGDRKAGGRAGWGRGSCRSVTAIASGWRAKISARCRLSVVSFVLSDAPEAGAPLCSRPRALPPSHGRVASLDSLSCFISWQQNAPSLWETASFPPPQRSPIW